MSVATATAFSPFAELMRYPHGSTASWDIENASNEINHTIYVVQDIIANRDVQVKRLTVALEDLEQEVRNGLVYPLSEEDLDDIISFLD